MATLVEPPVSEALATRHSWIGGRAVTGRAGTRPAVNPATGAAFSQVSLLDAEQVSSAVAAAQAAFPAWSALPFRERGELLLRAREVLLGRAGELARLIEQEQGKPAAEAYAVEIFPALESLKHAALHAEEILRDEPAPSPVLLFADKECRVTYAPYGVVLVITPWNYPLFLSLSGVGGRPRRREHGRPEAGARHDGRRPRDRLRLPRGRLPRRRRERRVDGRHAGARARRGPTHREDPVRRQRRDGEARHGDGRPEPDARPPGARREGRGRRLPRRRPRAGRARDRLGSVRQRRPDLRVRGARLRRGRRGRRVHRSRGGGDAAPEDGGPGGRRRRDRADDPRAPAADRRRARGRRRRAREPGCSRGASAPSGPATSSRPRS